MPIGIRGLTDIPSWLVIVDSDIETIERYLRARITMSKEQEKVTLSLHDSPRTFPLLTDYLIGYDAFLTLNHETVHFWQAISTPYMYYYASDYLTLCLDVVAFADRSDNDSFPDDVRQHFRTQFDSLDASLGSGGMRKLDILDERLKDAYHQWERRYVREPDDGLFETLQVIEGCAVLCAYRLCDASPSHENFVHHLNVRFPYDIRYSGAYHIATDMLGEIAFDLFAPACYLALHHLDNPGHALHVILEAAKTRLRGRHNVIEDPLTLLLEGIHTAEERCFPIATRRNLFSQQWHPVLKPYIESVALTTDVRTSDVFARPYMYFYNRYDEVFRNMLPPILVYTKNVGRFSRSGLAARLGDEYVADVFRLTTLAGIANGLIGNPMLRQGGGCHHTLCPVHQKQPPLCQCYVAFPPDDYKQCKFPELLKWFELDRFLPPNAKSLFLR